MAGTELTIPMTTIYKPTYAHELYKLPKETVKYWAHLGVNIGRCLGEGVFATAYEGKYGKDAKLPSDKTQYVGKDFAVKVIHIAYHPYVAGAPNKDKVDDQTKQEMLIANRKDILFANIIEYHFTAEYPPNANPPQHVMIFMEKAMFPLQDLLNCLIKKRAQVPASNGIKWIVGILSALKHLHSINIIHADLHSYNIFVTGEEQIGNSFHFTNIDIKIADFGKSVDVSKETEENKIKVKSQEMERISLSLISICDNIAFAEEVKKKVVDLLHQVFQKKCSMDDILKTDTFECPKKIDSWNIFITQI